MADTPRDLIKCTVSNTPGTASGFTVAAAVSGWLALGASDDGLTFTLNITESGVGTELRSGAVYTHGTTSLTRGTMVRSTGVADAALDFTAAAIVSVVPKATDFTPWNQAALEHVAGTDADTTMAIGMLYVVDMSAWATADRTYTLPATAAVGSRIGIMVTSGNASYELIIKPGASDTINGGSAAAEWSRLFITGEVVILRCVTADSAWVVEHDGRIPCVASMYLAADEGSKAASTWNKVGVDSHLINAGGIADNANERINIRRTGHYDMAGQMSMSLSANGNFYSTLYVNGVNQQYLLRNQTVGLTGTANGSGAAIIPLSAGQYVEMYVIHNADPQTHQGGDAVDGSRLYAKEIL